MLQILMIFWLYLTYLAMNTSQDQEHLIPPNFNRSCKEKIQGDLINSQSEQDMYGKSVKSQKGADTHEGIFFIQQFKKQWLKTQKDRKSTENAKQTYVDAQMLENEKKKNDNKLYFGTQLLQSETVSLDEDKIARMNDIYSEKQQNNSEVKSQKVQKQNRLKEHRKKVNLNLLLLGKSGIGKTSFSDSFCNKKYETINPIRQRTEAIQISSFKDEKQNVQISLIDIPGYQEVKLQEYIKQVQFLLGKRLESHINIIKEKRKGENRFEPDLRVHCCLYFISGPWISDSDWCLMKRIEPYVNIIPIIAKGDSYTSQEIRNFKRKIYEKNRAMNLRDFSIQQLIRQNQPSKLDRLLNGPFGKSPPFVITCCNQKDYDNKTKTHSLFRQYKWGRCELDNDQHNDFKFLKQLLTIYLVDFLVNQTDVLERGFIQSQIENNLYEKKEFISENSIEDNEVSSELLPSKSSNNVGQGLKLEQILKNTFVVGSSIIGVIGFFLLYKKQLK